MNVTVRLFAIMAEHAGTHSLPLTLPDSATLAQIPQALQTKIPHTPWPAGTLLALNQEYVPASTPLHDGDEIAVIPPVSGG